MVKVSPVIIRCPTCRKPMIHFTQILFGSNFTVILNGQCCGAEITSGELNIMQLLPLQTEKLQ